MHLSPTAPSYVAAVAAVFLVPLGVAVTTVADVRARAREAVVVGLIAAVPAIVFASAATLAPDDARRGGLVWSAVGAFPDVAGRSPVLVVLAFLGGFAATVVATSVPARHGAVLATSLVALAMLQAVVTAGLVGLPVMQAVSGYRVPNFRRRRLFHTTKNELKAMAAAPMRGLRRPATATGIAATL